MRPMAEPDRFQNRVTVRLSCLPIPRRELARRSLYFRDCDVPVLTPTVLTPSRAGARVTRATVIALHDS